jgi:hypothetical protein
VVLKLGRTFVGVSLVIARCMRAGPASGTPELDVVVDHGDVVDDVEFCTASNFTLFYLMLIKYTGMLRSELILIM